MAQTEATPHLRASRAFGRVEGLRAFAAVFFAVSVAAFTLPPARAAVGWSVGSTQFVIAAFAALAGFAFVFQSAVAVRASAHGHRTTGSRVGWALLTMTCGLAVVGVIPLRALAAAGRHSGGGAGGVLSTLLIGAAGVTLLLLGFGALRRRRQVARATSSSGDSSALPALPVLPGRLREAPYGAAEALLAAAVAVFFALIGTLRLASFEYSYSPWQSSDSANRTSMETASVASALLVLELLLLVQVWRRRRPRLAVTPRETPSDVPALVTGAMGLLLLLMIPLWRLLAGGFAEYDHKEGLVLASMAFIGLLFLWLGFSRMPASRGRRLQEEGPLAALAPSAHTHGGLATPGVAFEALRERPFPSGLSYSGIRRLADLPAPRPVGFSLTRSPDGALMPPAIGIFALGAISLLAGLPILVMVLRKLLL